MIFEIASRLEPGDAVRFAATCREARDVVKPPSFDREPVNPWFETNRRWSNDWIAADRSIIDMDPARRRGTVSRLVYDDTFFSPVYEHESTFTYDRFGRATGPHAAFIEKTCLWDHAGRRFRSTLC